MPIQKRNQKLYPKDWKTISKAMKERAGWKCEQCGAAHHQPHPITGSGVVLTTHHKDARPWNCDPENLEVLCQKCHLAEDLPRHLRQRKRNLLAKRAIGSLFDPPGGEPP